MIDPFFTRIKMGLIVSCQALEGEPLHGDHVMAKMAKAVEIGGAVGIRANGVDDIVAIKKAVNIPVIGLIKQNYEDSEVYITPTFKEVNELIDVGVDMIALDATHRNRPHGEPLDALVKHIKNKGFRVMADISTLEEGINAESLQVDCVSTTLSGYTSYSSKTSGPDFKLLEETVNCLKIPVIAEGKFFKPTQVTEALKLGAHAVVVGSAITRPQIITKKFVAEIQKIKLKEYK